MSLQDTVIASSSIALRVLSYIFLRWIPGHPFPPLIVSLAAIYSIGFGIMLRSMHEYRVIAKRKYIINHATANDTTARRVLKRVHSKNELIESLNFIEMITVKCEPSYIWRTLLTGLPSPRSHFSNILTFSVNVICFLMVMDFTYRAMLLHPSRDLSFARVGFVSDTSVKILLREPAASQLPIYLSYRYADKLNSKNTAQNSNDSTWKHAWTITQLSEESDFTAPLEIAGLNPNTRYQFALSNNHSGFFVTASPLGQISGQNSNKFTFLQTSCVKANFPYNPLSHPLSVPGFSHLAKWLSILQPQFLLFLGDFIYVDVPRRFGTGVSNYREEYRRVYASPDWTAASKTDTYDVPWLHVYDDHEIANDWDRNTTGLFSAAFDPYKHYHISVNPPSYRPEDINATYFAFSQGPAAFFMLDTRRFRDASAVKKPDDPTKTMLGTEQLKDLLEWLRRPEPGLIRWKFVISSVPFTKNWRFNALDTWSGYLAERKVILETMWDLSLVGSPARVVILSGDRHEFAATAFPPPPANPGDHKAKKWPSHATVHEFSASPLNMFYLPLRTYKQTDHEDVCVKYIPDGNSKFGAIEIESQTGGQQSILRYRLFIDGEETWNHTLFAP